MKKLLFCFSLLALMLVSCTPTYMVVFTAGEGGSVSSPGGEYDEGTVISVTANPSAEYEFERWSDGSTQNPRSITVTQATVLTASFVKKQYEFTVNVQGEGTVKQDVLIQGSKLNSGSQVKLTALPATGWYFDSWTGSATGNANPLSVDINSSKTITAVFKRKKFDLTVSVEGEGTVSEQVVVQPGQYDYETQVKLTAVPETGWEFTAWSGDLESTENPVTVTVEDAQNITANFTRKKFDLIITIEGEGTVTEEVVVQPGQYDYQTKVKLTATPAEGWEFVGWNDYTLGNQPIIEIDINSAITVKATFLPFKKRNIQFLNDQDYNYVRGENFIVLWEKDYSFYEGAINILKRAEFTAEKAQEWGMKFPKFSDEYLINIYTHNRSGVFEGFGMGVGTASRNVSMPYVSIVYLPTYVDLEHRDLSFTLHETFHIMQYNRGNTFPYSGDDLWYTESSAVWFERSYTEKFGSMGSWANLYDNVVPLIYQPQLSIWNGREKVGWSYGVHQYGMSALLEYLTAKNVINEAFIGQSFYSETILNPQEYLFQEIDGFDIIFEQFACDFVTKDMYEDSIKEAIQWRYEWHNEFGCEFNINCPNGVFLTNQFVAEIGDSGTQNFISPLEKNQAWSWSVIKITPQNTTKFNVEFVPDEFGSKGTPSDFSIFLASKGIPNQQITFIDTIELEPGEDYYLVVVSKTNQFSGLELFDYNINITPSN